MLLAQLLDGMSLRTGRAPRREGRVARSTRHAEELVASAIPRVRGQRCRTHGPCRRGERALGRGPVAAMSDVAAGGSAPQAQVDKDKQKEMQLKASTMQRGLERRCLTNSVDPGGL